MAKYKIARDGHPYLTQGYPVLDKHAADDVRFCTYQVNAGGERVFERAGFVDGDRVPEEVSYTLLLDGDLYNEARPNGIPASSIPNKILAATDAEIEKTGFDKLDLSRMTCLLDVFEKFLANAKNPLFALSLASWIWIYTKRKHYTKSKSGA
jgi:hypothetical protein